MQLEPGLYAHFTRIEAAVTAGTVQEDTGRALLARNPAAQAEETREEAAA